MSTQNQEVDNRKIALPKPHPNQRVVVDDVSRFRVLNAGRRFGKNVFEHDFIIRGVAEGRIMGWGSPTYKNLTEDWRTLGEVLKPIMSRVSEQERRIECRTGGILEMWSLDNIAFDALRGRAYSGFVINEAAYVRYLLAIWNNVIRPTLIDRKGRGVIAGTPNGLNDFFVMYNWGQGTQPDWKSWHYTSYDNPYLDPKELDALRLTMSEREFQQEIMAEFLQNDAAVFRNLEATLLAPYEDPGVHHNHVVVAGCDWGKLHDFTVMSVGCADCKREIAIDRFNQIDYHFQKTRLETMHDKWKVKKWMLELNSIGVPNFETLQRAGLPVVGFTTTLQSKQPLIESLSLALERSSLQLLPDDVGRSELQAYEVKRTETGLSKYSAPAGMFDDTVIARALMWRAMQSAPSKDAGILSIESNRRMEEIARLRQGFM